MNQPKSISETDLLIAIKEVLQRNGHLNKIQAEMRAKVIESLQAKQICSNPNEKNTGPPTLSEEVLLINELIREYLEWNGYLYTASVMASEAGLPLEKKPRCSLCSEVGVKDDERSSALPLLSNIVAAYTERIKRKLSKTKKET